MTDQASAPEFTNNRAAIRGWRNEDTGHIFCRACADEMYTRRSQQVRDNRVYLCAGCGRDASYPLHRDYRLYELDGGQCPNITGMEYDDLRRFATAIFRTDRATDQEDQNAPLWDPVLCLQARDVWEYRERTQPVVPRLTLVK